jgi:ATP-dependent helicase STH1/SNF2
MFTVPPPRSHRVHPLRRKNLGLRGLNNTIVQLRKVCNHPFIFDEAHSYLDRLDDSIVRTSGKFELLDRILPKLKRMGHKVLIFSQMKKLLDVLGAYLMWRGLRFLRLDGAVSSDVRASMIDQFNAKDSPFGIFILSTRAGGVGVNLPSADTVIIFDSDWSIPTIPPLLTP